MFNSYVKLPEGIFPNSWDHDPIWRTHIFQGGCIETTNQHRLGDEKGTSSSWKYLKNAVSPTNLFVSRTVVYSSQAVQKKQLVFFMMCFFADLEGNISRKPRDFFPQMRLPCLAINPKTCKSCPGIRHWLLAWCQNTLAMDFPIVFFHG